LQFAETSQNESKHFQTDTQIIAWQQASQKTISQSITDLWIDGDRLKSGRV